MFASVVQTQAHHFPNYQKQWISTVERLIVDQVDNPNFRISDLAFTLGVSERQLYCRIKKILGMTPNALMQDVRMEIAKEHLKNGDYGTVAEVSFAVGYNCPQLSGGRTYLQRTTSNFRYLFSMSLAIPFEHKVKLFSLD